MNTIMAKTPYDSSLSSSQRTLHWTNHAQQHELSLPFAFNSSSLTNRSDEEKEEAAGSVTAAASACKKKKPAAMVVAVTRLRSLLTALGKTQWHVPLPSGLANLVTSPRRRGQKLVNGTFFGYRRGHMYLAFQGDPNPKGEPSLLIELAAPTTGLVREMASGLARIALQCDKKAEKGGEMRLLDEPLWTAYCNGRKCGFAMRRECGPAEWKVLKAVESISMGAGLLPGNGAEGELMYMRAMFERVVGSRDSEAFYMINPEPGPGGPDLSIYLVRI